MFHDRATNSKLNRIQERALRMVCKDSESGLADLKKKYGTIHQHNLQLLMIEIFKTKNNLKSNIYEKNSYWERYSIQSEKRKSFGVAKSKYNII